MLGHQIGSFEMLGGLIYGAYRVMFAVSKEVLMVLG